MDDQVMEALTAIMGKLDQISGQRNPELKKKLEQPEVKPGYEIEPMEEMEESEEPEGEEMGECGPEGLPMKPGGGVDVAIMLGKKPRK